MPALVAGIHVFLDPANAGVNASYDCFAALIVSRDRAQAGSTRRSGTVWRGNCGL
jgi:Na+/H+-dicarboxylate symporter